MDFNIYLAVTGAELDAACQIRKPLAWMGCQLSAAGDGISGVPPALPPDSILVLTDQMPPQGHEPQKVASELIEAAHRLSCDRLLLDFQRSETAEGAQLVSAILGVSELPVAVSENFCHAFDCPVFLRPPPLWTALEEHIAPWGKREIWLEAAQEDAFITVTETGSRYMNSDITGNYPFWDDALQISYSTEIREGQLRVFLHRGEKELQLLLEKAQALGIHTAVGLYQHLTWDIKKPPL